MKKIKDIYFNLTDYLFLGLVLFVFLFSSYKVISYVTENFDFSVLGGDVERQCTCIDCYPCPTCPPTLTPTPTPTEKPTPSPTTTPSPTPTPSSATPTLTPTPPASTKTPTPVPTQPPRGGLSNPGAPVCTDPAPAAPKLISTVQIDKDTVRLAWEAAASADNYSISYGSQSGEYPWGAANIGNVNQYEINGVKGGCFVVAAINGCAQGGFSNEICIGAQAEGIGGQVLGLSNTAKEATELGFLPELVRPTSAAAKTVQRIMIPDLFVDVQVAAAPLKNGYWQVYEDKASWAEGTGLPGQEGNQVIFAHARAGLFAALKATRPGMIITLEAGKSYQYLIEKVFIVEPGDLSILDQTVGQEILTLYTCAGEEDSLRLVVRARRINMQATLLNNYF